MPDPAKQIPQSLQDSLTALGTAATGAATKIADLKSQISTGMTQQDVDSVKATIDGIAGSLNSAASNVSATGKRP